MHERPGPQPLPTSDPGLSIRRCRRRRRYLQFTGAPPTTEGRTPTRRGVPQGGDPRDEAVRGHGSVSPQNPTCPSPNGVAKRSYQD